MPSRGEVSSSSFGSTRGNRFGVVWNEPSLRARYGDRVLLALKIASNLFWWLALAFAALGIVQRASAGRWRAVIEPPALLWGYFALVHAVTVIQDRYHFPSIPWIAMYSGLALASIFSTRRVARPAQE